MLAETKLVAEACDEAGISQVNGSSTNPTSAPEFRPQFAPSSTITVLTRGGDHATRQLHARSTESLAAPGDRGVRRPMRAQGRTPRPVTRRGRGEGEPPDG